jgi:predicted dehydrogenase
MISRQRVTRRHFLARTSAAAAQVAGVGLATAALPARGRAAGAAETVVCGVIGTGGRGAELAAALAALDGVRVATLCDVDQQRLGKTAAALAGKTSPAPTVVGDLRRVLDDRSIDAVVIAAPDHWHGPATILACAAGKHVYVEKPASHNPREGELMVEAARKHNRVVQLGTQRRSMPGVIEAVERIKQGAIGRALFARGWYNNSRPAIGHGKPAPVPVALDYDLWQGPAPRREYRDNRIPYNWHWFWHWGTGELGNNGIHALDVCRWGLGVDYPLRITAGGGKYHYDDDQETPDTHVVTFDFGDKGITWEGRNWSRRGFEGSAFGMTFYGDKGTLVVDGGNYRLLDPDGKTASEVPGSDSQTPHLANFFDCIHSGARPNADIAAGHKSTLLCHLGNIAYRTGRTINLDAETHQISGDNEAAQLWGRAYEPGWDPKV